MMPAELRPNWKRKQSQKEVCKKVAKDVNIEETLKMLEQKEKGKKGDGVANDDENKESENVSTVTFTEKLRTFFYRLFCRFVQEDIEDEEQDEEMDEDNDYGNNYFDDGGNYLDEDDNLDDGPTY